MCSFKSDCTRSLKRVGSNLWSLVKIIVTFATSWTRYIYKYLFEKHILSIILTLEIPTSQAVYGWEGRELKERKYQISQDGDMLTTDKRQLKLFI